MLHSWTLGQLAERSAHVADGLRAMGLRPGQLGALPRASGRACVERCGMLGTALPNASITPTSGMAHPPRPGPRPPAGDAVAIDMPLTADAVAAYLGIVLAGCAAVSIADSFVAREIAARCRIAGAKAIFTQVRWVSGWLAGWLRACAFAEPGGWMPHLRGWVESPRCLASLHSLSARCWGRT